MLRVIGCQPDIAWEDRAANFEKIDSMLVSVPPSGEPTLIVLPEMYATGFSMSVAATAEPDPSPVKDHLESLASRHGAAVMAGLVEAAPQSCGFGLNQSVVVGPNGREWCRYQKNRTFRYTRESDHYVAGDELVGFEFGGLRVTPLICYDLRFPELFRRAVARQGTEAFIVIASWPSVRVVHWLTLLRARAIEIQAWVVGVNRTGSDPNGPYPGRSVIVDPHGVIQVDAGEEEGIMEGRLDPATVTEWRAEFPALEDLEA